VSGGIPGTEANARAIEAGRLLDRRETRALLRGNALELFLRLRA
jgi:hypothetical protein